jgi:hypothetical protein
MCFLIEVKVPEAQDQFPAKHTIILNTNFDGITDDSGRTIPRFNAAASRQGFAALFSSFRFRKPQMEPTPDRLP